MLLLFFLILKQKQGLFTWALDTLKKIKIRIPFFENRRDKILETDAHISDFYSRNTGLFLALFASYFVQAWLWAAEIYLTFIFLGGTHPTFFKCFLIVTLGSFYSFLPVPGSVGVYELTYVSLFALLRIEMSAGMAVILIRRFVGMAWAGLGLIPLLRKRARRGGQRTSGALPFRRNRMSLTTVPSRPSRKIPARNPSGRPMIEKTKMRTTARLLASAPSPLFSKRV